MEELKRAQTEALDTELADAMSLHQKILASGQVLAGVLVEFCKELKEMRDRKLYLRLGCDSFEDYVEAKVGLRKRQAYNYISTYERIGEKLMTENAGAGITKLALLAQITAPDRAEFAETHDLAGMSVTDLEDLIKKVNGQARQLTMFEEELKDAGAEAENYKRLYENLEAAVEEKAAQRAGQLAEELAEKARRDAWEMAKESTEKLKAEAEATARREASHRLALAEKAQKKAEKELEKARIDHEEEVERLNHEAEKREQAAWEEAEARMKKADEARLEELHAAEERAKTLERQMKLNGDKDTMEFLLNFDNLQTTINRMDSILHRMKQDGRAEQAEKLENAMKKALETLMGKREGVA